MTLIIFLAKAKERIFLLSTLEIYLFESTLDVLKQELDSKNFFRISRKFIIPIKSVKEIVVYSNSRLRVILPSYKEEEVIVSREKGQEFKN